MIVMCKSSLTSQVSVYLSLPVYPLLGIMHLIFISSSMGFPSEATGIVRIATQSSYVIPVSIIPFPCTSLLFSTSQIPLSAKTALRSTHCKSVPTVSHNFPGPRLRSQRCMYGWLQSTAHRMNHLPTPFLSLNGSLSSNQRRR